MEHCYRGFTNVFVSRVYGCIINKGGSKMKFMFTKPSTSKKRKEMKVYDYQDLSFLVK